MRKIVVIRYEMHGERARADGDIELVMPERTAEELEGAAADSASEKTSKAYTHAALMVYAMAKLQGYRDGYITSIRIKEGGERDE